MSESLHVAPLAGKAIAPSGADLVLTEVIDPGGGTDPPTFIAPLHLHDRDDEAWYVLDGALAFRVDGPRSRSRPAAASSCRAAWRTPFGTRLHSRFDT